MFQCHVCGNTAARQETVSEVFQVDGRHVLVEGIPARMCSRCGEPSFSRETTEKIRLLLHGNAAPARTEPLDVFALT